MRTRQWIGLPLAAVVSLALVACDEGAPTGLAVDQDVVTEFTFTQGLAAPPKPIEFPIAFSTLNDATASLGGSSTEPLSLAAMGCDLDSREVKITYTLTGNQASPAWVDVNTVWTYDGDAFVGGTPTTLEFPIKSGGGSESYDVDITVANASDVAEGTTALDVTPFNLVTNMSDPSGQRLSLGANSTATIHVEFLGCEPDEPRTPPVLTLPGDRTHEATTKDGTHTRFHVSATNHDDEDITADVVCSHDPAGYRYPIGETKVTCSVADGDLSTTRSFIIYVEDTTAPTFTVFPDTTVVHGIVATNINGAVIDMDAYTIEAKDWGPRGEQGGEISGVVDPIVCTVGGGDEAGPAHSAVVPIGHTVRVTCAATDLSEGPAPDYQGPANTATAWFDVTATLAIADACEGTEGRFGLGTPLRITGSPSAHKANSAIPHKVCPPLYADGTPAIDLADNLTLTVRRVSSETDSPEQEFEDPAAGSTQWRYDAKDDHYVFNAKTGRNWVAGTWETEVSYTGVVLAWTIFVLR